MDFKEFVNKLEQDLKDFLSDTSPRCAGQTDTGGKATGRFLYRDYHHSCRNKHGNEYQCRPALCTDARRQIV